MNALALAKIAQILQFTDAGMSIREIERRTGIHRDTIRAHQRRLGLLDTLCACGKSRNHRGRCSFKIAAQSVIWTPDASAWLPRAKPVLRKHSVVPQTNQYPFIAKATDENAEVMAVSALVPRGIPSHIRADICQEILLAIYEGKTSLDILKQHNSVRWYISKFFRDQTPHHEVSITDHRGFDDYDSAEIISQNEWEWLQSNEIRKAFDSLATFNAPTQERDAINSEITRAQANEHKSGRYLSRDEVISMLGLNREDIA